MIMQTVAIAGLIRGRTILNSLWIKFAPSIAAASSRETGISEAKFFSINTVKGITAPDIQDDQSKIGVIQPHSPHNSYKGLAVTTSGISIVAITNAKAIEILWI